MENAEKVRENRIRRMTERQGFRLVKSRRRDPRAVDFGRYRVETGDGVEATAFTSAMGWGLTLDEVEKRLTSLPVLRAGTGLRQPERLGAGLDDVGVICQPVHDGRA